jgi:hypothetical protein
MCTLTSLPVLAWMSASETLTAVATSTGAQQRLHVAAHPVSCTCHVCEVNIFDDRAYRLLVGPSVYVVSLIVYSVVYI